MNRLDFVWLPLLCAFYPKSINLRINDICNFFSASTKYFSHRMYIVNLNVQCLAMPDCWSYIVLEDLTRGKVPKKNYKKKQMLVLPLHARPAKTNIFSLFFPSVKTNFFFLPYSSWCWKIDVWQLCSAKFGCAIFNSFFLLHVFVK